METGVKSAFRHHTLVLVAALGAGEAADHVLARLRPDLPALYRYLVFLLLAKLIGDAAHYALDHRRREWLYLDDYLLNDVFLIFRYGFLLIIAQAYLAGHWIMDYFPTLAAIWRTSLLDALFYLATRIAQDREMDRSHHPGKQSLPLGGP